MQLLLGYEILESYQRLPYKAWYALAEFIDNSTQSYTNKKLELTPILKEEGKSLFVNVNYNNGTDSFVSIKDNAYGMNEKDLQRALILGRKPDIDTGRSKYGLGLKTAAFWFGDNWTISSTQFGDENKYTVEIDLKQILKSEEEYYAKQKLEKPDEEPKQFRPNLTINKVSCPKEEHGTTILITKLIRRFTASTAITCKEYLSSIYRKDIENGRLELFFQGEQLRWSMNEIKSRLAKDATGSPYFRSFSFEVGKHTVKGWAGLLKSGSRKWGGFSLLQADRVITGYPAAYKPKLIFGDQEGGTNNLVNQRLIGELELDGFAVSHTKDQILFADEEEVELEEKLYEAIGDFKRLAENMRVKDIEGREEFDIQTAVATVLNSVKTYIFKDVLFEKPVLPEEVIIESNLSLVKKILVSEPFKFEAKIGDLEILVLLSDDSSVYDPYLVVEARSERNKLIIVINKNHPYWIDLDSKSAYNFLTECIYDGIAEWKANFIVESLDPSTIKLIKDHFLRLNLTIN